MAEAETEVEDDATERLAGLRWVLSESATALATFGSGTVAALYHAALLSIPAALAYLAHRLVDAGLLDTIAPGATGVGWMLMAAVIGIAVVEEVYRP